jgi:hypothetical protein
MKTPRLHLALLLLTPFVLGTVPTSGFAATPKEREAKQQERIADGIKSGELTPAEAAKLEAREAALRKQIAEDRAANGGKLTPEQRKQVQKELDEISEKIARNKHDAQQMKGKGKSKVGKRERNQQERIGEGVASGQLTPAEAARLEAREAALRKQIAEGRAANGGKLTPEQRKEVQAELDELSARIAQQKHDAQTRK